MAAAVLLLFAFGGGADDGASPRAGAEAPAPAGLPRLAAEGLGSGDGYVAEGASLSPSSEDPAVANLDPILRDALRRAADAAAGEGIALRVNGGWRSARYQRELLRRAIEKYGSLEEARRYTLPPAKSKHVSGEAIDVGPSEAAAWLSEHGNEYGLCRIYENEPWHFELATTPGGTCPPLIADATGG